MSITDKVFAELTAKTSDLLRDSKEEGRFTICCWMSGRSVHVGREWPHHSRINGPTGLTSANSRSPVGNVVSRLMTSMEDE